jgi:hypothetical protein
MNHGDIPVSFQFQREWVESPARYHGEGPIVGFS